VLKTCRLIGRWAGQHAIIAVTHFSANFNRQRYTYQQILISETAIHLSPWCFHEQQTLDVDILTRHHGRSKQRIQITTTILYIFYIRNDIFMPHGHTAFSPGPPVLYQRRASTPTSLPTNRSTNSPTAPLCRTASKKPLRQLLQQSNHSRSASEWNSSSS
jgi:hypothetical protein